MKTVWRFVSSPLRTISDENEKCQKKTFTKWINYHLETHSSSGQISNLYTDLRDGVFLCHLIEVLTGDALPVNKAFVSKRVHHMTNLQTCLTHLRGRGLELVNNNASDLADGNPRIILGLIWQIILHFQVETAIELLREWGLDASSQGGTILVSDEPSSSSSFDTPTTSRASFRLQQTPDRILRRWLASEIGLHYGIRVEDMDRSWKDGVAFCALVHRCRPDLVDMEKVKKGNPRENLSMAFELAKTHLGIRPLLDVDDLMVDKPDKRSVVTYVSQFLRPPPGSSKYQSGVLPVKSRVLYQGLIQWIDELIKNEMFVKMESSDVPISDLFTWRFKMRQEFLEKKAFYNDLKQNHHVLEASEWDMVNDQWTQICIKMSEWNKAFDKKLPQPLMTIADWLNGGEKIIGEKLELDKKSNSQIVKYLEQMIVKHNAYFKTFPIQRERFYTVAQTGLANGQKVDAEIIKTMRKRVEYLSQEVHQRMKSLLLLQIHFRIQCFVDELEKKINLWKSPPNLAALKRFQADYKAEAKTKPDERAEKLLRIMKETTSEDIVIPSFNNSEVLTKNEEALLNIVNEFKALGPRIKEQKRLWAEFEAICKELEAELILCQTEKRTPRFDCRSKLDEAKNVAQKIMSILVSTAAGLALKQRLKGLESRVDKIDPQNEPKPGPTEETRTIRTARIHLKSKMASDDGIHRLKGFVKNVQALLRKRPNNRQDLAELISELNDCAETNAEHDELLNQCLESDALPRHEAEALSKSYRQTKQSLNNKLEKLRELQPILSFVETKLKQMEEWTQFHSPDSELAKLSVRERSELVDQLGAELAILERPENKGVVATEQLRALQQEISSLFVQDTMQVDEEELMKSAIDQLKNIKNVNETAANRINALKARFETTKTTVETEYGVTVDDTLVKQRIDELLQRKQEIIERKIDSETGARGAINEMQIINVTLAQLKVENDDRSLQLEARWSELYNNFNRIFVYLERIKQYNANINKYRKYRKILMVIDEVNGIIMALKEHEGCVELTKNAIDVAENLKGKLHEKRAKERKRLEQRVWDVQRCREDEFEKAMVVIEVGD
ncbi:unnamed protein product [Bursaphelenchus okinawaensis]|uniref:Calponin-homology (CH) domain-containing protein n=1 Tax=Bursaphelenchus okinawaensis TaxID=465554 RepID=A0A811JWE3_9BILA|nr:unnamed protein product [Bursaphelenchus okinawaensis]CAG9086154.1 unnamed protein product [Bursaphelenchus okinawaensis]